MSMRKMPQDFRSMSKCKPSRIRRTADSFFRFLALFPGVWHRYSRDSATGWDEHWVEFDGDCGTAWIPDCLLLLRVVQTPHGLFPPGVPQPERIDAQKPPIRDRPSHRRLVVVASLIGGIDSSKRSLRAAPSRGPRQGSPTGATPGGVQRG